LLGEIWVKLPPRPHPSRQQPAVVIGAARDLDLLLGLGASHN